ncbi:dUTPase [Methanosarcinales archaeon]|nr:MAG: dUTPase [Methanosarcinales archaeon]
MAKFYVVNKRYRKHPNEVINLPVKATNTSAGYDFFSTENVTLHSHESHMVWTDVKVKLKEDECLMIVPRSSVAIKKHLILSNIVGIIDADYFNNPDNDGNIGISLYNYGHDTSRIVKDERIAQGIVVKIDSGDKKNEKRRIGGFGSTGR